MSIASTAPWQHGQEKLLNLINIGRFSLLLSLLTFHLLSLGFSDSQSPDAALGLRIFQGMELYAWAVIYGCLTFISLLYPQWQSQGVAMPNANAVVDITMMVWLMHMAGGIGSGFGILILPFITTSCLLSYGRYPLLYAGYASLLIVLSTYWMSRDVSLTQWQDMRLWVNAVMLIAATFLVALFTSFTASYLARTRVDFNKQELLLTRFKGLTDMVLNYVQEAVVVLDEDSKVRLFNQQARATFPSLVKDEPTSLFKSIQQNWQRNSRQAFEIDTKVQDHAVRVRARPFVDGDIPLLMVFLRLEKDLAQEAMGMKLKALGQLTANLAHEVRNPMSAIRQANGLLQEDEQDPMRLRLNDMIEGNIARIDKMLEDVSALSKSDKTKKQRVDLMMFWREFKQEFLLTRPEARGCISLKVTDGQFLVWCDRMHLQQVMWNLFNNAWRHSQQNDKAIQLVFRPRSSADMSIMVMDNGEGVPQENQAHLFEPFFTTSSEGTGLGLYVARELAHANMGRLEYRAQLNAFELILPRVLDE